MTQREQEQTKKLSGAKSFRHVTSPLTAEEIKKRLGVTEKDEAVVSQLLLDVLGYN